MDSKWVNGAAFYYEPHYEWWKLIDQRVRWFCGTVAAFIYFMWVFVVPVNTQAAVPMLHRSQERQSCRKFLWVMQLWASFGALLGPGFSLLALDMSDNYIKESFAATCGVNSTTSNASNASNDLTSTIISGTRCVLTNITWGGVIGHACVQYNIVALMARAFACVFLAWLLLAFFCSSQTCKKNPAVALVRNVSLVASVVASAAVMVTLVFVNGMYVSQSGFAGEGLTVVMVVFFLPMVLALTRGDPMACVIMTMLNFMGYMWVMVFYFSFVPWYVGETREDNPTNHSINEH